MTAVSDPSVGDVIADRYEIKGEPRRFPGYTGYRAFDREVEVEVALWWVRREMFPGPADRARFLRAAADARKMQNDNARRLFDAAEIGDYLYATVQLATGERMQDRVARGDKVSDQELLGYAVALCEALSCAHEAGLVHGRLVPEDIVTVSGLLKVGGIGLWHCAGEVAQGVWGDAARYVAPEAWSPAALGPRADVFSAAVILAELTCGGGGELWKRTGEVRELKDELALARSDVASELTAALEADPARRVDSPATLLATLRAALGAETLGAQTPQKAPQLAAPEPPIPVTPPPIPVAPPPIPVAPRPIPVAPPPISVAPPPVREMADASLPTTPFNRPVPLPSQAQPLAPRKRAVRQYVAVAALAAVGVALIAWVALNGLFGDDTGEVAPATTAQEQRPTPSTSPKESTKESTTSAPVVKPKPSVDKPVVVAPGPVIRSGPCPEGMVQVESYCIDAYESPGAGRLPETGMTYAMAEKACTDRGARLCEPKEWERACRGPKGWSYPYGTSYRRSRCNTDRGGAAEIGAAGSFGCASAEGVHDLSGNVAEWVAGGRPRGGAAPDGTDGRCSRKRKASNDRAHDDVGYRCCADAQ